jgi:hypothetical protein
MPADQRLKADRASQSASECRLMPGIFTVCRWRYQYLPSRHYAFAAHCRLLRRSWNVGFNMFLRLSVRNKTPPMSLLAPRHVARRVFSVDYRRHTSREH